MSTYYTKEEFIEEMKFQGIFFDHNDKFVNTDGYALLNDEYIYVCNKVLFSDEDIGSMYIKIKYPKKTEPMIVFEFYKEDLLYLLSYDAYRDVMRINDFNHTPYYSNIDYYYIDENGNTSESD